MPKMVLETGLYYIPQQDVSINEIPAGTQLAKINEDYKRVYGKPLKGVDLLTLELQCKEEQAKPNTLKGKLKPACRTLQDLFWYCASKKIDRQPSRLTIRGEGTPRTKRQKAGVCYTAQRACFASGACKPGYGAMHLDHMWWKAGGR